MSHRMKFYHMAISYNPHCITTSHTWVFFYIIIFCICEVSYASHITISWLNFDRIRFLHHLKIYCHITQSFITWYIVQSISHCHIMQNIFLSYFCIGGISYPSHITFTTFKDSCDICYSLHVFLYSIDFNRIPKTKQKFNNIPLPYINMTSSYYP